MAEKDFNTFLDFYPFYLKEHTKPLTKLFHFVGSWFSLGCLVMFFQTMDWRWFLAGLTAGYGFAWFSHFFIEKNKPATFKYPGYSFIVDWVMFSEILRGKHQIFSRKLF